MTSLLTAHLEQIALCSTSIADLSFPGPKIFTNALLLNTASANNTSTHDITSLIRDTEAHERALFHLAPPSTQPVDLAASGQGRRATTYNGVGSTVTAASRAPQPKRSKAVAAVLGGDLYRRTRRAEDQGASGTTGTARQRQKGDVDVGLLLEGAEKLGAVYPTPGAREKIEGLRRRYAQLSANIAHYEARVERNTKELQMMTKGGYGRSGEGELEEDDETVRKGEVGAGSLTTVDLEREMAEVKELERKRKAFEDRVQGFDSDLRGLA